MRLPEIVLSEARRLDVSVTLEQAQRIAADVASQPPRMA
jgi:hypothetical protein